MTIDDGFRDALVEAGEPFLMATPAGAEMSFWVDVLPGEDREEVLRRFESSVREVTHSDPFLRDNPPNEYVPIDDVIAATKTLATTITDFCGA